MHQPLTHNDHNALPCNRTRRARQLSGLVQLVQQLAAVRQLVLHDRVDRPERLRRQRAAVVIASWYHAVLCRRRTQRLVQLVRAMRRVARPYIQRLKPVGGTALRLLGVVTWAKAAFGSQQPLAVSFHPAQDATCSACPPCKALQAIVCTRFHCSHPDPGTIPDT
jgi:hypothetical protein